MLSQIAKYKDRSSQMVLKSSMPTVKSNSSNRNGPIISLNAFSEEKNVESEKEPDANR